MKRSHSGTHSLANKLKNIIDENPDSIRAKVAQEALDRSDSDEIKCFFSDLLSWSCSSGMIPFLIYYSDTHSFFDEHYKEIEDIREEWEFSTGQPLQIKNDLKNFLSWFAFEETAYQIANELSLDI